MEYPAHIVRPVLSAVAFFGTLWILSVGYSAYSGLASVQAWDGLTAGMWTQVKDNFDDLNSKLSNFSFASGNVGIGKSPATKLDVNGVITASNVNQAPIFSTTNRTAYYTSAGAAWQSMGTSITITVPAWPNRKYRLVSRVMGYYTSAWNYMYTTVSTSPTSIAGVPSGMADIYEYMLDTGWHTVSQEWYVDLAPGTYTYYIIVWGGSQYTATYDYIRSNIIAWPL